MVGVDHHHLGRPSRDAARLGGAGGAVEHLEEAHQAAGGATAGEPLHLPAQLGEVGAAARAILEDARLVVDQIEDGLEIVVAALDEAGRHLRPAVGVAGLVGGAGGEVHRPVAPRALDLVLVPEPAVEPYRAVEGADLVHEVVAQLGLEGLRVGRRGEVAALGLAGAAERVGHPPHELPHRLLGTALGWHPGLAEVLAHRDVGGELRPFRRHLRVVHLEDHFAVGAGDLGGPPGPLDFVEDVLRRRALARDAPLDRQPLGAPGTARRRMVAVPVRGGTCGRRCLQPGLLLVPALRHPYPSSSTSRRVVGRARRIGELSCAGRCHSATVQVKRILPGIVCMRRVMRNQ